MNAINQETNRQFSALAPRSFKFGGKTYKGSDVMFCDKSNTVFFKHYGRKQRGGLLKDQLSVIVKYDSGSDTYTITVKHFDGFELLSTEVASWEGMYFYSFADLQTFINHSETQEV